MQNDWNILISTILLLLLFIILKSELISLLNNIPHFCLFDKLIGMQCPFCGTTRAFCAISEGSFNQAITFNTSSIILFIYFFIQIPLRIASLTQQSSNILYHKLSTYFGRGILIFILLNWIFNLN
ncbi:DUF2752 domain-containing protein [Aquimarina agarilytica]|uniref:DUF2752 domain-containing protein n=1 Tax=Aquimarina agarilytica TaxID=1087449 RepID=UPI00373FD86E